MDVLLGREVYALTVVVVVVDEVSKDPFSELLSGSTTGAVSICVLIVEAFIGRDVSSG